MIVDLNSQNKIKLKKIVFISKTIYINIKYHSFNRKNSKLFSKKFSIIIKCMTGLLYYVHRKGTVFFLFKNSFLYINFSCSIHQTINKGTKQQHNKHHTRTPFTPSRPSRTLSPAPAPLLDSMY